MQKFCKKCQAYTEFYRAGGCKPCMKLCAAKHYINNKKKINEKNRAYYVNNLERSREIRAIYYKKNSEEIKKRHVIYRNNNKELLKLQKHRRRAREKNSFGKLSKDLTSRLFKLQKGKCPCCKQDLGSNYHLDHIVPLALGGSNTDDNIQLLRAQCNRQKSAKDPIVFMQSRGFLL